MAVRRPQLNDESGIALVMAVGIMFVLALGLATIIFFSTSNESAARYSKSEQDAFSLAEAGINNAYGVLAKAAAASPSTPITDNALLQPGGPGTTYVSNYANGSVRWTGSYDAATSRWTLRSTATTRNPSGQADVTRTVTASVLVTPAPGQPNNTELWNYVTMRSTGAACDLDLQNSMTLSSRLYLPGNLCVQSGSEITGGPLIVGGDVTLVGNPTKIGSNGSPIPAGTSPHPHTIIGGDCKHHTSPRADCRNGAGGSGFSNIWVSDEDGALSNGEEIDEAFPVLTTPTADFGDTYDDANPGPAYDACAAAPGFAGGATVLSAATFDNDGDFDPTTDGSITTPFDLAPSSYSYTCKTAVGELSWNSTTRELTVSGVVFIDGSAFVSGSGHTNKVFDYDGKGVLYLTGTMLFSNQVALCAVAGATDCDWNGWDPNSDMLMILADGNGGQVPLGRSMALENSTHYQGALYGTNAIELQNQALMQGPIVGETLYSGNNAQAMSFPYILVLPAGAPGNPNTVYTLARESFVD